MESKIISSDYSADEIKAGIKNLAKYGYYNQIKFLMTSLKITKEEVLRTPAIECFLDLDYESTKAQINNRLNEIITQRHK